MAAAAWSVFLIVNYSHDRMFSGGVCVSAVGLKRLENTLIRRNLIGNLTFSD